MSIALSPSLNSSLALLQSAPAKSAGANLFSFTTSINSQPVSAPSVSVTRSSDPYINGLLSGTKWSNPSLTYGFPATSAAYEYTGEAQQNFHALNAQQRAAIDKALASYASAANLTFSYQDGAAADRADIRFADSDRPSTAWAYTPTTSPQGGDVWFNYSSGNYSNPATGNYAYHTVLHEIGHALGLKHAHETSAKFATLPAAHQSMEYTVMSYSSFVGASTRTGYTNQANSYAQSLMMDDIAAVQTLYGANYATNAGDTTYTWNSTTGEMSINGTGNGAAAGNRVFMTVWDGGGSDTYDFRSYSSDLKVNLTPGSWTTTSTAQLADLKYDGSKKAVGNVANARLFQKDVRSLIENAIGGGGNDNIIGNQADNQLEGGAGNDTLNGGIGNDRLNGGAGADAFIGGTGLDTVDYSGATAAVSFSVAKGGTGGDALGDKYSGIERFVGTSYADSIAGGSAADALLGGDGNDTISGGGGADVLTGGSGADTFRFATAAEVGKLVGSRDRITDFAAGEDTIDLSAIDANTRATGKQTFEVLGTAGAAFTAAGQIRYRYETTASGERTIIEGNIDSAMGADFAIELSGHVNGLSRSSFTL